MNAPVLSAPADDTTIQCGFLALLSRIRRHAEMTFGFLRCPTERADCVQDALALAWAWYRRLASRGRDAADFAAALANAVCKFLAAEKGVVVLPTSTDTTRLTGRNHHGPAGSPA